MVYKKLLVLVLVIISLSMLLMACALAVKEEQIEEPIQEVANVSVWNVYWDHENIEKEIEILQDEIDEICYFAAYFDSSNNLFIPEEVTNNFERVKKTLKEATEYTHYLSIVNDKINLDGSSTLKDTELLYDLLGDENKLRSHINAILTMVIEGGYDGVEIDYETIRKDQELWGLFINYCGQLYENLESKDLKMRVLLEPSFPGNLDFPLGPSYIMMCYNLYGLGTEPGPKADQDFIIKLVEKMESLPGEKGFAFATGGFDWAENGEVIAVTEKEASEQMDSYGASPNRDENSQSLYYDYIDSDQVTHEVWFADGKTLSSWAETIKSRGDYNISLWRLSGNRTQSLEAFKKPLGN